MLTENQKRFISLVFACPLQNSDNNCNISKYRSGISPNRIIRQVKKITEKEFEEIFEKHDKCFLKRNEELLLEKINRQLEIKKILTERQFQVVKLICKNYTNNDVSEELKISPHTVVSHRRNVYKQLNVRSIKELKSIFFKKEFF